MSYKLSGSLLKLDLKVNFYKPQKNSKYVVIIDDYNHPLIYNSEEAFKDEKISDKVYDLSINTSI